MAALSTQVIGSAGTEITFADASSGGDTCQTGAGVLLLVDNASASPVIVTIATPGVVDGDLAIADRSVSVAAGAIEAIPVTNRYRDPATGVAAISYGATPTDVSVAVIR